MARYRDRGDPGEAAITDRANQDTDLVPSARDGWRLIGRQLWDQRLGILVGVAAGLIWTLGKVTVPRLVGAAIDRGMEEGDVSVVAVSV